MSCSHGANKHFLGLQNVHDAADACGICFGHKPSAMQKAAKQELWTSMQDHDKADSVRLLQTQKAGMPVSRGHYLSVPHDSLQHHPQETCKPRMSPVMQAKCKQDNCCCSLLTLGTNLRLETAGYTAHLPRFLL